ncbi:MAG: site-2 protease family protein [Anaerolineae bacterium]|nr:site-2 protease family protein [Anaerolineae bacterium]
MFGLTPDILLGRLLVIVLGIPIHEWAHCWVAHVLGDSTPDSQGRLTLNPLAHLDPVGTLMILIGGFGWGRAARVNPFQMSRVSPRTGMALTALAGPFSNIVQAMILAIPFRLGLIALLPDGIAGQVSQILVWAIAVNVGLAVFNMLPIPPLDGSRILAGIAPGPIADFIERLEPIAPVILMTVLFILPRTGLDLVNMVFAPVQQFVLHALLWW